MGAAYLPAVLTVARKILNLVDDQLIRCHGVELMMRLTALVATGRETIAPNPTYRSALQAHLNAREILNHCDHCCARLCLRLLACSSVSKTDSEGRQFTQRLDECKQLFRHASQQVG